MKDLNDKGRRRVRTLEQDLRSSLPRHLFYSQYFHFHFARLFSVAFNDMMDLLKLHLTLKWRLFMLIYEFMFSFMSAFNLLLVLFSFLLLHSTTVFIIAITFLTIAFRDSSLDILLFIDVNLLFVPTLTWPTSSQSLSSM